MKSLKFKLCLTILFSVLGVSQAQLFLTNGLVSFYPFNGNAHDAIGTNNGTIYGAVLSTNRFGKSNSAYLFNGSSSYIDLGQPTNLLFINNSLASHTHPLTEQSSSIVEVFHHLHHGSV